MTMTSEGVNRDERRIEIAPSILAANIATLGQEVNDAIDAGAHMIHFDVMDNHYVPNLTFGPIVCRALRQFGVTATIDVHLMTTPVDALIDDFAKAGADLISFHPEASLHPDRSLKRITAHGCKAGLAFNPTTPLDILEYTSSQIELVLLMSINPGFGGQKLQPSIYSKIEKAKKMIESAQKDIRLSVDGGVNIDNIRNLFSAGADTFVIGSAFFGARNPTAKLPYKDIMQELLAKARS